MPTDEFMQSVLQTLEEHKNALESLNQSPNVAPVGPDGQNDHTRAMSSAEVFELRDTLRKKSTAEIHAMLAEQMVKRDSGISFDQWMYSGGYPVQAALAGDSTITKALDSGSGAALIRQDLEPMLLELYVREFPWWDRITKEPANGLVHAFNQITSFGDAQFMAELGTVTDDRSTYVRQTTNVAVLATRRGVSLKGEYAVRHGGMSWNPAQLEIRSGLRAVAHKMQKTIFQGNATDAASAGANTEKGAYDPNGFTGFRMIFNTARASNVDPATDPETTGNVRRAIDLSLTEAMNNGGTIDTILLRPQELQAFNFQQDANVRYMRDLAQTAVGVNVQQVNTIFGSLGMTVVPGDSIGEYDISTNTYADIYFVDSNTVTVPYLGSEGPTVLDIPVGVSGQLVRLFIVFGMWGLAVKAPIWGNKLRVLQP